MVFLTCTPWSWTSSRQSGQRVLHAIVREHEGSVDIGADLEDHRDGEAAVTRRLAADVVHVLDAVDGLFERRRDSAGDRLRRGAGVGGRDLDGRRDDVRVLGDRQERRRRQAEHRDEDIDHRSEPRVINEEMREFHGSTRTAVLIERGGSIWHAATLSRPAWAIGMPSMMTRSEASRPERMTLQAVAKIAQLNLLRRHHVVWPDGQDDVLRLIGQHAKHPARARQAPAARPPGERGRIRPASEAGRCSDGGARMNRAARPIEGVIDEVQRAFASEGLLVAQGHLHLVGERPLLCCGSAGTSCSRLRSYRSSDRSGRSRRASRASVVGLLAARLPATRLPTETR